MACHSSVLQSPNKDRQKILSILLREQRRLNRTIRRELHRFADAHWTQNGLVNGIGLSTYRLRQQIQDEQVIWWVERDIPPRDRFRCVAYLVQMRLDASEHPVISVQSGQREIPVVPMNSANLSAALVQAGRDLPLIIPRQMGDALDP